MVIPTYDNYGNANVVEASGGSLKVKSAVNYDYPNAGESEYSVTACDQNGNDAAVQVYDAKDGTLKTVTDVDGYITGYNYNSANDTVASIVSGNRGVSYTHLNSIETILILYCLLIRNVR